MDTDRLIDNLVADLTPVRPLPAPWRRVFWWLAIAIPVVALIAVVMGLRPDLPEKLADPSFAGQEVAMLLTAALAAWAAMSAVVPGTPRWVFFAPAVPMLGWVGMMGAQCWEDWTRWGSEGLAIAIDLKCVPAIAMAGVVPLATMIVMIRKGARFNSSVAVFWGTLAAAALANAGLRLFHTVDAGMMVIVWQFGTVLALTAGTTLLKDYVLPPAPAAPAMN